MKPDRLPLLVLILGAAIIGLSPIFVRLSDAGPAATGFWRLGFAAPLLLLLMLRERRGAAARRSGLSPVIAVAGAMFAADLGFWHYAIHFTTVANATVLSNGTPILVTAAAWLMFRERPKPIFLGGMALAILGAVVMAEARPAGAAGRSGSLGDLLAVSTAVWYAGYFLAVREARKGSGASSVMFWSGLVGMPALAIAAAILGEPLWPKTPGGWAACVGLGLVHVTGQGAIAWALGRVPTAYAAVAVLVQPVVAAILGWALFAEAISPIQGLGAVAALAGVALAQTATRGGAAKTPPEP